MRKEYFDDSPLSPRKREQSTPWYKEVIGVANKTLKIVDSISGTIPAGGEILGAVAKVVLMGGEMAQVSIRASNKCLLLTICLV